jgi:hypothetical protein
MTWIKIFLREFIGLENDYESLLSNQEKILESLNDLKKVETLNQEILLESQKTSYYDYLTLKNALWVLFTLGVIGSGLWLYNADFFNNSVLESLKSLGTLSKDLHSIDQKSVFEALKKLNENSVNLSKEEIKLLLEIKNLLLKKGIDENPSLDKPINLEGTFTLGNPISGVDS